MNFESSLTDAICDFYAVTFYSFIYCHVLKELFHTDDMDFDYVFVLALTFTGLLSCFLGNWCCCLKTF